MSPHRTNIICGLDEAGRGPLAGPLVASAVIIPLQYSQEFQNNLETIARVPIRDSKKLTPFQRLRLFTALNSSDALIFTSIISVSQINAQGIGWANQQIFINLINQTLQSSTPPTHFIVDGNLKESIIIKQVQFTPMPSIKSIPRADALYPQVSLASIVAKVTRDKIMADLHRQHPHFGWNTNQGYGTKVHISALHQHGTTPHHRTQFVETALKKK